jgi:hypothetical protein
MLIAAFLNTTVGWSEKIQEEMSPAQTQEYKEGTY